MKAGVIAVVVAVAVAMLSCCHVCLAEVDYYEVRRGVVEIASSGVCAVCELTDRPLCARTHGQVLGVARDANARTIKKAYRKLSLKYHPDKQAEPSQTTQDMFVKVADGIQYHKATITKGMA